MQSAARMTLVACNKTRQRQQQGHSHNEKMKRQGLGIGDGRRVAEATETWSVVVTQKCKYTVLVLYYSK